MPDGVSDGLKVGNVAVLVEPPGHIEVEAGSYPFGRRPQLVRNRRVLDGAGNFDEAVFPTEGFSGVTLRLYDAARDRWSLYWASSRTGILSLPPVVGRFGDDGRGVFTGDDVYADQPIVCRCVWSNITRETARWEQAFSTDGGATWEVNWIAEFSRADGRQPQNQVE